MATNSAAVMKQTIRQWSRTNSTMPTAATAVGIYAAVRLTGIAAVAVCAWASGRRPGMLLGHSWDARWYTRIAHDGYGTVTRHSGRVFSDLVFFPLFPGLERGTSTVLPVSVIQAGLLIAWLSALAAAWGLYAVGTQVHDRRTGALLVILWGLLPDAVVQTMGYTEALMTALAAWSLWSLLTGRWILAGSLALLAGLTRPNGIAVAVAVTCSAALALARSPHSRRDPRIWAASGMSVLGWLGYAAWVGARTGSPLGYFDVQRGWGSYFDFGRYTARFPVKLALTHGPLSYFVAGAVIIAALLSFVLFLLDRPPLPLVVYSTVLVVAALGGAHYFAAKQRLLLPAFPLLLPAALSLARARQRTGAVMLGGTLAFSVSYGVYLVLLAPTAP